MTSITKNEDGTHLEFTSRSTGELIEFKNRPRFRSAYDGLHVREFVTFDPDGERTKQEFKDQCDVNKIVANFTRTGRLDQLDAAQGMFLDISEGPQTYQDSLNLVIKARTAFDALPSDVRAIFGNDVQNFMYHSHHNPEALFEALKPLEVNPQEPAPAPPLVSTKPLTPQPDANTAPAPPVVNPAT